MFKKLLAILIAGVMILSSGAVIAFADDDDTEIIPRNFPHGDTNLDMKVNIKDATLIQKHLAKIRTVSEDQLALSDVDGKEGVNIKDATHLQKWLAGLAEKLIDLKEKAENTAATADISQTVTASASETETKPIETLPSFGDNKTEATTPATSEVVTDPAESTAPATSEVVTDPAESTAPATSEVVTDPAESTVSATSEATEATETTAKETESTAPTRDPDAPITLPFIPAM